MRDCQKPLERQSRRLICPQGHSFDLARSGYVNLLQPQERRSKHPGDTVAAVAARRRLHDAGVTQPLVAGVADFVGATAGDTVLDAGCGEGFYLGTMARHTRFRGCGIDISAGAIDLAAHRYPDCQWVVANADRFLPYAAGSFSIVLSITARMNPQEFHRVVHAKGRLLIALPAPDDLIELRGAGRDRVARTVNAFADSFKLVQQRRVTTTAMLRDTDVQDILHSIYRPMQSKAPEAIAVTFSLDLLLFELA